MGKIIVIGSSNTDMVIKSKKLPSPGETILGGNFFMNQGGKGANQAVAAARLGGDVTFVAKIGNDLFGKQAVALFIKEGIDTQYIVRDPDIPSGIALITVDSKGENSIVVASGSNGNFFKEDLPSDLLMSVKFEILLLQLEIPIPIVEHFAIKASENGIKVIVNPAPAQKLSNKLLRHTWLITPNETEAEILTNIKITSISAAEKAASILHKKGVMNVIITLGDKGAYIKTDNYYELVHGIKVKAIDTTAAGDVFNGALAVSLSEGNDIKEAVIFANKAASISVTRLGAQESVPYRMEIN